MKRPFKKLTAWLCCMAMLISFIPATALPVFAAEAVELTQTEGTLAAGEYVLSGDLALTGKVTIAKNTEVVIDLAGNDITGTAYPFFDVGGKLTITDSTATGTPGTDYVAGAIVGTENASDDNYGMIFVSGGTFTLEDGKLTGYKHTGSKNRGGAVAALGASIVNINGGEISNNSAYRGGGVFITNTATANINGGAIYGNTASNYGGGVHADTKDNVVNINGGIIKANTASRGSNVCMGEGTANKLTITGGTIAESGTGAYDGIYSHTGDVTISGGEIDRIYWRGGSVTVSGGEIGTFTSANVGAGTDGPTFAITGNPVIESLSISADTKVASIGDLTEGASVYFAAWGTAGVLQKDGTVATEGRLCTYQKPTVPTSGTVAAGEYTLESNLVLTNTLTIAADTEVTIDLAGHTISMPDKDAGYFTVNGKLTITDSVGGGKVQFKETAAYAGITLNAGSTFVLDNGELNGWVRAGAGAMMNMYEGSTFIMNDGLITGCRASNQPVIRPFGAGLTVEINGGAITGNNAVTGNIIGLSTGTDALPNTLTIAGDAVVANNTLNDAPWNASAYEIQTLDTIITVADEAEVGFIYGESTYSAEDTTYVTEMNISGAPTVHGIRWSAGARFTIYISELEPGANIKTANGHSISAKNLDATVAVEAYDNSATSGVSQDKGNIYTYKVPVYTVTIGAVAGGTVTVDPTEGVDGTEVTVTATPDEGYELVEILVDGVAIDGNTFAIDADAENVVTATFRAVDVGLPTSGGVAEGEYVLEADHPLTGVLNVENVDVVIDLAGRTLTAAEGGGAFAVYGTGSLTITDSVGGGKVVSGESAGTPAVSIQGGTFTLEAGEITGWNRAGGAGGMIFLAADTTFNMEGGKLTGTSGAHGSAIRVNGAGAVVNMSDGEISGNTATNGAPIMVMAGTTFNMTGGTITNNVGTSGGAIQLYAATSEVNIGGGTISNNTAANGGAIANNGVLTITGGTFTGNTGSTAGGAIQILKGSTTTITGGTFTGNTGVRGGAIGTGENVVAEGKPVLTIGGDAVIEENVCTEYGGNLYAYTTVLTINGGTIGTAIKGEDVVSKSSSANVWVRNSDITITGGDINGLTLSNGTATITGNPVIGEINATINMSALTSGASIRTAGVGMVTAGDDTVYTINDRDFYFKGDLGFGDKFVAGETVTLTEDTSAGAGVNLTAAGTYTLDLAGCTLTGNTAPYFTIGADVKLIITDSVGGGKIVGLTEATAAMILVNGEFELQGGTLTGHHNNAVKLGAGSTMTMTGGEISGNYANRGAGVTSGDVTGSGVTFTMTGGVIKDNVLTGTSYRGANLYFFDPAMVTLGGTANIGAAYIQDGEALTLVALANPVYNAEIRGGNAAVTGGTYKQLCLSKSSVNVTATISGAPKVELLSANLSNTTIGNLTTGARIAVDTSFPLTVAEGDKTVSAQARLYRYAGDVKSILFVANSFGGDTIKFLNQLGSVYGVEIDAAGLYVGSQSVRWHAQSLAESLRNTDLNGDGVIGDSRDRVGDGLYTCAGFEGYVDIPTVMEGKTWDYVVLQPGVQYVGYEGTYNSDIDFLMDYIADVQPDAEILWSQTWAVDNRKWSTQTNPDNPEEVVGGEWVTGSSYLTHFGGSTETMYDAILANTDKFIAGADARFAFDGWFPIGIAIQTMRNNYSDSYLTRDGFHLSHNAGRLIAGLTVMKTLFPEINLTDLTAEQVAAMFAANTENTGAAAHLQDAFEPTEANVATLLAAVETACGYKNTVPAYGDGTANKQFNPDAAIVGSNEYVAVYENVTEVGNVATNELYATTGAGKIVIYKDGDAVAEIDELWLEENAGIVLTDRYNKLDDTYYIMADAQAPQLAIIGSTLYLTFDVKLYSDTQNTIYNGGVYLTSSTDGVTWTDAVKVSDAPMAYGLTALSDGNLILSVADTTTKAVKISTAGAVVSSVELEDAIADAAFVEVGANTFALTSTGVLYVSTDLGLTWTATGVANGASASPDLIFLNDSDYMTVYATWADEAEMDIYSKVWNVDVTNTTDYGWNDTEASLIAEYAVATAYNGKTTGGQPTTIATSTSAVRGVLKTVYVDGGVLTEADDYTVALRVGRNLALNSSLSINFLVPKTEIDAMEGSYAKIIRSNAAAGVDPVVTIVELAECKTQDIQNAPYYVITFSGLAAKQMSDSVWVAIYNDAGEQVSRLDRYSIRDYATNRFTKNIGAEEKTMLVDMLNYGAAAQNKFNYGVSDLANANLTEAQQALATPELVKDDTLTQNGFVNTSGLRCGKNLTLESVVEMNLNYVKADVPTASYAVATYTDHNGKPVENRIEFKDFNLGSEASPLMANQVVVDTLATADVFTQVTVQVYDANDNVIEGTYCVYSIATYAYNTISKNATSADAVLAMRLMQFGTSAYNSLH